MALREALAALVEWADRCTPDGLSNSEWASYDEAVQAAKKALVEPEAQKPKVEPHDPEWDDTNGDHPMYTLVAWANEVGGGNTRLGYRQWVGHQIEAADEGMAGEGLDLLHGQRDQSGGVEPDEEEDYEVPGPNSTEVLEGMIDRFGLYEVLMILTTLCSDKAAHIRANGGPGDKRLARRWDDAANVLSDAADRLTLAP